MFPVAYIIDISIREDDEYIAVIFLYAIGVDGLVEESPDVAANPVGIGERGLVDLFQTLLELAFNFFQANLLLG